VADLPLRVLVIGSYDHTTPRARQLDRLLALIGAHTDRRRVEVWGDDRSVVLGGSKLRTVARVVTGLARVGWRFLRAPRPDVVLVPYPGHFDMLVLGPLARMRRVPVVLDLFISLHDTAVGDRGLVGDASLLGRALRFVDRRAVRGAQRVLADTPEHAAHFARLGGVDERRVSVVPVGADDRVFAPVRGVDPVPGRVLFYGTFIPLHGTDVIVRAAALLGSAPETAGVRVRMIGDGQDRPAAEALAATLGARIEFVAPMAEERLAKEIAAAEMCLGIFDDGAKAARVVPNKVFQVLAAGQPCITARTPAVESMFGDIAGDGLVLVPPGDPEALAAAVAQLHLDPERRRSVAAGGRRAFDERAADVVLAPRLRDALVAVSRPGNRG
jgi:glycosyltransferase involved in cell wall biosynthesis